MHSTRSTAWILAVLGLTGCGGGAAQESIDQESAALVGANALDTSFGSGGQVTIEGLTPGALGTDLALQTDGKIVIGTSANDPNLGSLFAVVRLLSNGALDTTFGSGGIATTPYPVQTVIGGGATSSIALQADGKIVVTNGFLITASGAADLFSVARFNTNGSLDTSFGNGGLATASLPGVSGNAAAMIVQPDGKLLLAGSSKASFSRRVPNTSALVRFLPNGTLDGTFGAGGIVVSSGFGPITAMGLESDGSVLVTSNTAVLASTPAARFSASGALEPVAVIGTLSPIKAQGNVTFTADGRIVVGAAAKGLGRHGLFEQVNELTATGASVFSGPAFDWGTPGVVNATDVIQTVAGAAGGKIVAGGIAVVCPTDQSCLLTQTTPAFGVAALSSTANPPGSLIPTFGAGGIVQTRFGQNDQVVALAVQPADGKVVALGISAAGLAQPALAVARYRAP